MPIAIGQALPDAVFFVAGPGGVSTKTTADVFNGKTVALFAVPGAFTPTCDRNHLPGIVAEADRIRAKGVDTVAVTGVNDAFVLQAWAKASGADGAITFLADGNADFAKAVGLDMDGSSRGMGPRSLRYAMLVKNGIVAALDVEDSPGQADVSSAEALLSRL